MFLPANYDILFLVRNITREASFKLYCFSPPVMLATLLIEFLGAMYVWWRYKFNQITRLIISLLLCLGVFQLAEFFICTQESSANFFWARIGHAAITLLPPLGLQLIFCLANKKGWWLCLLYVLPVAFSGVLPAAYTDRRPADLGYALPRPPMRSAWRCFPVRCHRWQGEYPPRCTRRRTGGRSG